MSLDRFRLNISIPFENTREESSAAQISNSIVEEIKTNVLDILTRNNVEDPHLLVWLSFDLDRTSKNYLVKTENGHATKNKTRIN